ncbi:hypothetical protein KL939_004433 [Ogataea angusta]|nr:hypothetical protein KL939_004433 [Ogataea angusta]
MNQIFYHIFPALIDPRYLHFSTDGAQVSHSIAPPDRHSGHSGRPHGASELDQRRRADAVRDAELVALPQVDAVARVPPQARRARPQRRVFRIVGSRARVVSAGASEHRRGPHARAAIRRARAA